MFSSLALLAALSARAQSHATPGDTHEDVEILVSKARSQLGTIEHQLGAAASPSVQTDLRAKLEQLDHLLSEIGDAPSLHDYRACRPALGGGSVQSRPAPAPEPSYYGPPRHVPCSGDTFALLEQEIAAQSFDRGRSQIVVASLDGRWYSVDQVKTILGYFQFPDTKVDVAAKLYPHVTDTQNWSRIYAALPAQTYRDDLRRRIGQ